MDNTRRFLIFISIIVLFIVGFRYYQYIVNRNFFLSVNTECNPTKEKCFVSDCLPEKDKECDTSPYKKIKILARESPVCLEEHSCKNFSCADNSKQCFIYQCSDSTLEEGEKCSDIPSLNSNKQSK
jgi:hypothetical protein